MILIDKMYLDFYNRITHVRFQTGEGIGGFSPKRQ